MRIATQSYKILIYFLHNKINSHSRYRNGVVLDYSGSRYDGGTTDQTALLIKSVTRHDMGNYTCELTNGIGTNSSDNEVDVNVQFVPIVSLEILPDPPIIENEERNVTLYCNVASGNPPELTKVRWMYDGQELRETPGCDELEDGLVDVRNKIYCDSQGEAPPNQILLQNVSRHFWGNYSCEGFNLAGWGERSEDTELVVYYEPGPATLRHEPLIPVKHQSLKFSCSVEDGGNPNATRYIWTRGGNKVMDVVTPTWTIDPVGLDTRTNFSCHAENYGGSGVPAITSLNVHAAPAFINKLNPYSGFLYSNKQIHIYCHIECVPTCKIDWFKNSVGIDDDADDLYFIKVEHLPPDHRRGDFESVNSTLHFNMTAWPGGVLDIHKDNANYSCVSSHNVAGPGVRSATFFGVEFPPENTTIQGNAEVVVEESAMPPKVICQSRAYPEPSFEWRQNDAVVAKGNALIVNKAMKRTDAGNYTCVAFNKHGRQSTDVFMNITCKFISFILLKNQYLMLYLITFFYQDRPECKLERKEIDDEDTLICTGAGNPPVYNFTWSLKSENDTADLSKVRHYHDSSFLILDDDFSVMRTYRCRVENSAGFSDFCDIDVAGECVITYAK